VCPLQNKFLDLPLNQTETSTAPGLTFHSLSAGDHTIMLLIRHRLRSCETCDPETRIETRKDVGAECRHDMRSSVQLPSVSGVDSKFGLTVVTPSLQSAPEPPALDSPPVKLTISFNRHHFTSPICNM